MDAPALPPETTIIQGTYYTTSPPLHSCLRAIPSMSDAAEEVVLLRLEKMMNDFEGVGEEAVKWCVQMIGRVPHNDKIVTAVMRVMEKYPDSVPEGENSFCIPVCNLLPVHLQKPGFQAKGMAVIDTALHRETGDQKALLTKELVTDCDILSSILTTIKHHMDNAAVIFKAVSLLRTIFLVDTEYPTAVITDPSANDIFEKLFSRYRTSNIVTPVALEVIECIACVPTLACTLFEDGYITTLLAVHHAQPTLPTTALELICASIATGYDYQQYFHEGPTGDKPPLPCIRPSVPIPTRLIHAVQRVVTSCDHEDTVAEALKLLHRVAFNPDHVSIPNVPGILETFNKFPDSVAVTSAACAALYHPASAQTQVILTSENMALMLDTLEMHLTSGFAESTSVVLALLTRLLLTSDTTIELIKELEGMDILMATLPLMHAAPNVLLHASALLACLCTDSGVADSFAEMSLKELEQVPGRCLLDILLGTLKLYSRNTQLQSMLCILLKAACSASTRCSSYVLSKSGERMLKKILHAGVEVAQCVPLQVAAAGWARVMAWNKENTDLIAQKQGLESILDSAQIYGKATDTHNPDDILRSDHVLMEAALCTIRFAITNDDIRDTLSRLLRESTKGFSELELLRVSLSDNAFQLARQTPAKGITGVGWLQQWTAPSHVLQRLLTKGDVVVSYKQFVMGLGFR